MKRSRGNVSDWKHSAQHQCQSILHAIANLSQQPLVVVYHLGASEHGSVGSGLACYAKGKQQVLRKCKGTHKVFSFRNTLQIDELYTIHIKCYCFHYSSNRTQMLKIDLTSGAARDSWSALRGGVTATLHSSSLWSIPFTGSPPKMKKTDSYVKT